MTVAVVDSSNTVVNLIVADVTNLPPADCQLIAVPDSNDYYPNIGDTWDGSNFVPQSS